MTIGEYLQNATGRLLQAGIETPRLDMLILLEDALGIDRARILARLKDDLPVHKIAELNNKIAQRMQHLPLAYIRGEVMFYGQPFYVTSHVLTPRPESEAIVDLIKKIGTAPHLRIADIGTGSGCLGIAAAREFPRAHVELYDFDEQALAVARRNAFALSVQPAIRHADLLQGLESLPYDILIANLPYVPDDYPINRSAEHEPRHALFAGPDGMDVYRRFWEQVALLRHPPAHIITETLSAQHHANAALAAAAGYRLYAEHGLAQQYEPI